MPQESMEKAFFGATSFIYRVLYSQAPPLMSYFPRLISLSLVLALASGLASAQNTSAKKKSKKLSPARIMKAWDADKDQKLTEKEFSQSRRAKNLPPEVQTQFFKKLDNNGDGFLDITELRMAFGHRRIWISPKFLKDLDSDGDKKISQEEFAVAPAIVNWPPKRKKRIFKKLDRDKDGFLTEADRQQQKKEGGIYFNKMDVSGDNFLSREEFLKTQQAQRLLKNRFDFLDRNGDGKLSEVELYFKEKWEGFDGKPSSQPVPNKQQKKQPTDNKAADKE